LGFIVAAVLKRSDVLCGVRFGMNISVVKHGLSIVSQKPKRHKQGCCHLKFILLLDSIASQNSLS
jgi:hypothetical protein